MKTQKRENTASIKKTVTGGELKNKRVLRTSEGWQDDRAGRSTCHTSLLTGVQGKSSIPIMEGEKWLLRVAGCHTCHSDDRNSLKWLQELRAG